MIALLAALLFLIGLALDVFERPTLLGLGIGGWQCAGLVMLSLHVGGMAWLDGRRRRVTQ